jgi:hypothetical protein
MPRNQEDFLLVLKLRNRPQDRATRQQTWSRLAFPPVAGRVTDQQNYLRIVLSFAFKKRPFAECDHDVGD